MTYEKKLTILSSNADIFAKRQATSFEERQMTLKAMAVLISDGEKNVSLEEMREQFRSLACPANGGEEVILYSALSDNADRCAPLKELLYTYSNPEVPAGAHGRIAYIKNDYNNAAYEEFSRQVSHAKPNIMQTFAACAESVAEGENEFCISPIENASGGKLMSFYTMIDRYELKICSVCDIEDEDGQLLRYALLKRELSPLSFKKNGAPLIFEFSLIDENAGFLKELLSASNTLGALLLSVDSMPLPYDLRLKKYLLSFSLSSKDVPALAAFSAMNYPTFTPVGIYFK